MLSRGANTLILWLAFICIFFVSVVSIITWFIGLSPHDSFGNLFWDFMMRAITPWEIEASMGSLPYLAIMLIVTLFGIFVLSILISLLSAIIDARVRDITSGQREFPFSNHLVILGWSQRVPAIINELIIANQSEAVNRILIISGMQMEEVEAELGNINKKGVTTKTYWRCRDLFQENTYVNANLAGATKVLILADQSANSEPDRLKLLLSIYKYFSNSSNTLNTLPELLVAVENEKAANMCAIASNNRAISINVESIPARLIVETALHPSLPEIYEELLSFEGNEIYVTSPVKELGLNGSNFGDAKERISNSVCIGKVNSSGHSTLLPERENSLEDKDKLIVIAEDNSTFSVNKGGESTFNEDVVTKIEQYFKKSFPKNQYALMPKKVVIIGFSKSQKFLVESLFENNSGLKEIRLVLPKLIRGQDIIETLPPNISKKVHFDYIETDNFEDLSAIKLKDVDVIIVSHTALKAENDVDTLSIKCLLILKELLKSRARKPRIIAEMTEGKNKEIISTEVNSDFVVSEKIGSKVFAQFIENKELRDIVDELICSPNFDLKVLPVDIPNVLQTATFGSWSEAVSRMGMILIGWKRFNPTGFQIHINPNKDSYPNNDENIIGLIVITREGQVL